jgi:hypothetical protein
VSRLSATVQLLGRVAATLIGLTAIMAQTSRAASLDRGIIAKLQTSEGWKHERTDTEDGLVVRSKMVAGHTAFRGILPLGPQTDPDRLWRLLNDIEGHVRVGDKLAEAKVFARTGAGMDYFQVMVPPMLMPGSQRYWFAHTELEPAVGGKSSHRRRCWSNLPAGVAQSERAGVKERHPRAIEVAMTHGCWELVGSDKGTTLVYSTVTDPGGSLPTSVARTLASRTLPENMRKFVRAARR